MKQSWPGSHSISFIRETPHMQHSQLVVGQINREYEMRDQRMARYMGLIKQRLGNFAAWKLEHIPRDSNERADALTVAVASILIEETIFLSIYYQPTSSITTDQVSQIEESGSSWLIPILHYLSTGELPSNRTEAHKVQV